MINLSIFILNVVGTLLLSVEAIKLDNFQKLAAILKKYNLILNPKIVWLDEFGNKINNQDEDENITLSKATFLKIIASFYFITLLILYLSLKTFLYFYGIALFAIGGSFVTWTLVILLFEAVISFYKFLEKKLAKGIVGMLGFGFLLISFIFQYYLTFK